MVFRLPVFHSERSITNSTAIQNEVPVHHGRRRREVPIMAKRQNEASLGMQSRPSGRVYNGFRCVAVRGPGGKRVTFRVEVMDASGLSPTAEQVRGPRFDRIRVGET